MNISPNIAFERDAPKAARPLNFTLGLAIQMLKPLFTGCREIRMGAMDVCELRLEGRWVPKLPSDGWQNLWAQSSNGRLLALVAWAISKKNEPGFRIVVIDSRAKLVHKGKRMAGCCTSIAWAGTGFDYETYNYFAFKT